MTSDQSKTSRPWEPKHNPRVILCLVFFTLFLLSNHFPATAVEQLNRETVSQQAAPGVAFEWKSFLGPFHSVLLHFPIGFITMAVILELYHARRPGVELRRVLRLIMALCALSTVIVAALGLWRASGGGYDQDMVLLHKWLGISVVCLTWLALGAQRIAFSGTGKRLALATYRGLLSCSLLVLMVAGHLGGSLAHGSSHLFKNAPPFIRAWLEGEQKRNPGHAESVGEERQFFVEKIRPIFESKCTKCHGPERHMSDYRLDKKILAFEGGKSGLPAIVPGRPMQSHLARRILLTEHMDMMPPGGIEPLTPEEVLVIIHWIQKGAAFVE